MGLIVLENNKAFTTSLIISKGIGLEHRAILQLIKKYKERKIFQTSAFQMRKLKTKGKQAEYYMLSESQAMFLITLMQNSEKVLDFKEALVNAFIEYRNTAFAIAANKKNEEYIQKRQDTKVMRRECTDIIQAFIVYAKEQGSRSADHYYSNFSRMELSGLFVIEQKYPNARDVMNFRQLNLIEIADEIIANSLQESMDKQIPYKECFQIAKERIAELSRLMPKSPLPALLEASHAKNQLT